VTANDGTAAGAKSALLTGLLAGSACLNVHTALIPSGEIRGFLVARRVPEPSTILVAGSGVLAHTVI